MWNTLPRSTQRRSLTLLLAVFVVAGWSFAATAAETCRRTPTPDLYGDWKNSMLGAQATDAQVRERVEAQRSRVEGLPDPFGRLCSMDQSQLLAIGERVLWRDADIMVLVDKFSNGPKALVVPKLLVSFPVDAPPELLRRMASFAAAASDALACAAPEAQKPRALSRIYINPPPGLSVRRLHVHVQPAAAITGLADLNAYYQQVQQYLEQVLGALSAAPSTTTQHRSCMDNADCQPGEACVDTSSGPVCQTACSWPVLQLATDGTEEKQTGSSGVEFTRYRLKVTNWKDLPPALFEAAPDLPPCGENPNASRSWLDIFAADTDQWLYGFCALSSAAQLTKLWFGVPTGAQPPPRVYIKLRDRRTKAVYCSNAVLTGNPP